MLERSHLVRWSRSALSRSPRVINIGLLIAGLGLGQGAIFAVQTLLVSNGEFDLLAAFGTHYSFAILGIIAIDGGASTILARDVARRGGQKSRDELWRIFWETSAVRLLTALVLVIGAVAYVLAIASDGFSRCYMGFALPGLLVWAGNGTGLLDGLRLSGISGMTGSVAYVMSAIGLALAAHQPAETAGSIAGAAFSLGYLVTVAAQWIALGRVGWSPRFEMVTRAGLARSFRDALSLLFQLLPGQINMRVQLVLSTLYLGAETTALFLYCKQVVTALTQIIAFVLRVDFPGLVEKVSGSQGASFGSIFTAQKTTFYCAVVFTVGALIVAGIAAMVPDHGLHRAAMVMMPFAPTILTLSLSLMMIQALAALGAYALIARTVVVSSVLGIIVSYLLVTKLNVYAFAVAEVASHLVGFCLVYQHIRYLNAADRI